MTDEMPNKTPRTQPMTDPAAARSRPAMFPIQKVGDIPWELAEEAYADYSARYGTSQSLQRLAERGGFSLAELGSHLRNRRQDGRHLDITSHAEDRHVACEVATKAILAALAAARLACHQENERLKRELSFVGKSPYPPAGCVQEAQKKSRADLERAGYKPNDLQVAYRGYRDGKWNQPPLYDPKLTEMAIVDALVEQGGTTAWCGDGVGCVAQMIDAQAQRADAAEAARTALRQDLAVLANKWLADAFALPGSEAFDAAEIKIRQCARDLADRLAREEPK